MCAKKYAFSPDFAVAPGETVREVMEDMGMTRRELAMRLGITVACLNALFRGEHAISVETAENLERVTGAPARFWTTLERNYRRQLAREGEADTVGHPATTPRGQQRLCPRDTGAPVPAPSSL